MNPGDPSERAADEARLCGLAYLVWPIALYERLAPRQDASSWYRVHMRQALRFGLAWMLVGAVALIWPLAASTVVRSVGGLLTLYAVAVVLDVALAGAWCIGALRYGRRAGQGAFFTIGWFGSPGGARARKL